MQSQAAVTKERIVIAFALAFAERGYLAVNLNEVLNELDLTKGAFYFHFRSKDDVAREIAQRQFDLWSSAQRAALEPGHGALEALVDLVRTICRAYQTDPIARGGARLSSERSVIEAALPRPFVGWIDTFTTLLEAGQSRGEVAAGADPSEYANFIVAFVYGALQVSGELSRRQDLQGRLDTLWQVVLPPLTPEGAAPVSPAPAKKRGAGRAASRRSESS